MKTEYEVQVDVTMSGSIYVEAESEKEAIAKVKAMTFVASDLKNFHEIGTDIYDVFATNTETFGDVWK